MNQDNRIIHRNGARELTQEESHNVAAGIRTLTICTVTTETGFTGDEGANSIEQC